MYDHEKKGGGMHPRWLMEGFKKMINECNLMDMGYSGSEYTWEHSRGTANWVQERLDRGGVKH